MIRETKLPVDSRVTIRVEKDLKESAEDLFDRLGMNMSTAINVFLRKAVDEEAIPFSISAKKTVSNPCSTPVNATATTEGMDKSEVEKNQLNVPDKFNVINKFSSSGLPDETREYVNRYGKPVV